MSEVTCPYCDTEQEVCYDDGNGYSEEELHRQHCTKCEMIFGFRTAIIYHHSDESKLPCENGENCDMQPAKYKSDIHPDRKECRWCDRRIDGPVAAEWL